jgi:hypothetical protein
MRKQKEFHKSGKNSHRMLNGCISSASGYFSFPTVGMNFQKGFVVQGIAAGQIRKGMSYV